MIHFCMIYNNNSEFIHKFAPLSNIFSGLLQNQVNNIIRRWRKIPFILAMHKPQQTPKWSTKKEKETFKDTNTGLKNVPNIHLKKKSIYNSNDSWRKYAYPLCIVYVSFLFVLFVL